MVRGTFWVAWILAASVVLSGCPWVEPVSGTGGASGGADAGGEPWTRASPTWSSLYEVYFGPSGVAACSGAAACHGQLDAGGGIASNFTCADKEGCFASLTGASQLVLPADVSDAANARLLRNLRQVGAAGNMPSGSTFTFQSKDIDVIKTWISSGAKND